MHIFHAFLLPVSWFFMCLFSCFVHVWFMFCSCFYFCFCWIPCWQQFATLGICQDRNRSRSRPRGGRDEARGGRHDRSAISGWELGTIPGGAWKKHVLFSPVLGEIIQFDEHIFQLGWNHQPVVVEVSWTSPYLHLHDMATGGTEEIEIEVVTEIVTWIKGSLERISWKRSWNMMVGWFI